LKGYGLECDRFRLACGEAGNFGIGVHSLAFSKINYRISYIYLTCSQTPGDLGLKIAPS
jgi:hypothetical protein